MKEKWDKYGAIRLLSRNRLLFHRHRQLTTIFLDFFASIDTKSKVLDIGCGDGFWLELLRNLGFNNLCGIDLSKPMVGRALLKNLDVECKDIYEIDYYNKFDIIIMMDVLEHLPNVSKALMIVNNALKTNGILYITTPTCDSFSLRLQRFIRETTKMEQMQRWDETHIHAWSAKDVKNLLKEKNFDVKWMLHSFNPFPFVGRLSKKLYKLFSMCTFWGRFGDLVTICSVKANKNGD